ncbi:hypothetical protein GCM10009747_18680 [Agromyces humatus]|uniref:Uncharacterized protein n=1 Tax=Agromyces humatus TaxID=279573 RepID=A0ABN2KNJ4_9MICO
MFVELSGALPAMLYECMKDAAARGSGGEPHRSVPKTLGRNDGPDDVPFHRAIQSGRQKSPYASHDFGLTTPTG